MRDVVIGTETEKAATLSMQFLSKVKRKEGKGPLGNVVLMTEGEKKT